MLDKGKQVKRYNYMVLQIGSLPLGPDKVVDRSVEHRCNSVLIWPEDECPGIENTILTDPCFTIEGYKQADKKLSKLGLSLEDIGYLFITHRHGDHCPNFLYKKKFIRFRVGVNKTLSDFEILHCPGHSPKAQALVFRSPLDKSICIAGDTVLDLRWLKAWKYYWPNLYFPSEVVQTWESVAKILSVADIIIPGHGDQIHVTASLVKDLLSTFPLAECADECQDVSKTLSDRLAQLHVAELKNHEEKLRKNQ